MNWLFFALVTTIFGTTFLAAKVGLQAGFQPLGFAALRFLLAGGLLLAVCRLRRLPFPRGRREWARTLAAGSLMFGVDFACSNWGLQHVSSSAASFLSTSGPVFVAVFSHLGLGARLRRRQWAGTALATLGVVALVGVDAGASTPESLWGRVAIVAGHAAFGLGSLLCARLARVSPFALNAVNMLVGGVLLALAALAVEPLVLPADPAGLWALAYLVVPGSIVGHSLNLLLVSRWGAVRASSWFYPSVLVAAAAGAAFLGERLSAAEWAGGAGMVAGLLLIHLPPVAAPRLGAGTCAGPCAADHLRPV